MSKSNRATISVRPSASRKLLAAKAQATEAPPTGENLEESFPVVDATDPAEGGLHSVAVAVQETPTWSNGDEQVLQGLLARRKAAG